MPGSELEGNGRSRPSSQVSIIGATQIKGVPGLVMPSWLPVLKRMGGWALRSTGCSSSVCSQFREGGLEGVTRESPFTLS